MKGLIENFQTGVVHGFLSPRLELCPTSGWLDRDLLLRGLACGGLGHSHGEHAVFEVCFDPD
jgi:hypothetical protein